MPTVALFYSTQPQTTQNKIITKAKMDTSMIQCTMFNPNHSKQVKQVSLGKHEKWEVTRLGCFYVTAILSWG